MPSIGTLIIGGGVAGASLAYAMSMRGAGGSVALVDVDLFGRYSSSALCGGSVRSFFSHPLHRRLNEKTIAFYQTSARRLDYVIRGGIRLDGPSVASRIDKLLAEAPVANPSNPQPNVIFPGQAQPIDAARAGQLFPSLAASEDRLTWCPADGRLSAHKLHLHLIQRAEAGGLQLLDRWQVVGIEGESAPWRVTLRRVNPRQIRKTLSDGVAAVRHKPSATAVALGGEEMVLLADQVVNAAGSWASEISRLYENQLPITSFPRPVFLLNSPSAQLESAPWLIDSIQGLSVGYYRRDNKPVIFVTCMDLPRASGIDYSFPVEGFYLKHLRDRVLKRLPGLADAVVTGGWISHDDLTPDFCPIVGSVPGKVGLYDLAGFSGHGLAIAPALGQAMAHLLQNGTWPADLDLSAFSQQRFGSDLPGAASGTEPLWF